MKAPRPISTTSIVIAALDREPYRYVCGGRPGFWTVTHELHKATPFELDEAFDALERFKRQLGSHIHTPAGDWKVYQATARTSFGAIERPRFHEPEIHD